MAVDGDQRAALKVVPVALQDQQDIIADALRAYVVKPELDHAGQGGPGAKEQFREVQVLREDDGSVLTRPIITSKSGALGAPISRQWWAVSPRWRRYWTHEAGRQLSTRTITRAAGPLHVRV